MLKKFLLITLIVTQALTISSPWSFLPDITDNNIEQKTDGYHYAVLLFYNEKCKTCDSLYDELEKTVKLFKETTPKEVLKEYLIARVDWDNFKISMQFKITKAPAIGVRVMPTEKDQRSFSLLYLGELKPFILVDWIRKRTISLVNYINEDNKEEIFKKLSDDKIEKLPSFVYMSTEEYSYEKINEKNTKNYYFNIFLRYADNFDQYQYYYCQYNKQLLEKFGYTKKYNRDYILLFKNFGEKRSDLIINTKEGNYTEKIMNNFLVLY